MRDSNPPRPAWIESLRSSISKMNVQEEANSRALPRYQRGAHICFKDVTFGYEPSRSNTQEYISRGTPGRDSGFGGSVRVPGRPPLASMIPRFFDPWSGAKFKSMVFMFETFKSRVFAHRFQSCFKSLFCSPLTVAQNIAYGRPEASAEEIQAAAYRG